VLRDADHSAPSNSSNESITKAANGAYSSDSLILFIKSRKTCAAFLAEPLRAMVHWYVVAVSVASICVAFLVSAVFAPVFFVSFLVSGLRYAFSE
jgi:hypothetical protein